MYVQWIYSSRQQYTSRVSNQPEHTLSVQPNTIYFLSNMGARRVLYSYRPIHVHCFFMSLRIFHYGTIKACTFCVGYSLEKDADIF